MPKSYFVVRSTVADASKREAFDNWYQEVHLPDALRLFGAKHAWRCWSLATPSPKSAAKGRTVAQSGIANVAIPGLCSKSGLSFRRDP
jgi:hypothetical protein